MSDDQALYQPPRPRSGSANASNQESGSEYTFASSSDVAASRTLPVEILAQILNYVSFPDLYGSTQFVDRVWHFVTTQLILGNAIFLRRLVNTDYQTLIKTHAGNEEHAHTAIPDQEDDTWPGVALDTSRIADLLGFTSSLWRGSSNGDKVFLEVQEFYNQPQLPYILRGQLLTYREQLALSDEEYSVIKKISLEQHRPVLLDVHDFDDSQGNIMIDLSECYRLLFADYKTLSTERKTLVALLETDLWTPWAQKYGKYWGKKAWGVYKEGIFIDTLEQFQELLRNSYQSLERVFDQWDLIRRKMEVYENASLQTLADHPKIAFEETYKHLPASWAEANPGRTITRIDATTNRVVLRHQARYDRTIELMVQEFDWNEIGGAAHGILSDADYERMYDEWKREAMIAWRSKTVYERRITQGQFSITTTSEE